MAKNHPILETERLQLYEMDPELHAAEIRDLVVDTFDRLHNWMSFAQYPPKLVDIRQDMIEMVENRKKGISCEFAIWSKHDQKLIGNCGITKLRSRLGDRIRDTADSDIFNEPWFIGYWLHHNYEGQGYISEACAAMMDYGKKIFNVDYYLADVDPRNQRSTNSLQRLGFTFLKSGLKKNHGCRSDWPVEVPVDFYIKKTN